MLLNETRPESELHKVVRLTNKTDFDFTPQMGAMYGGVPYMLPAGKSMLLPKPVAMLLAKHLARQVFIKKAPIRDEKEIDGKGSDRALWTDEQITETLGRFISEEYEEEKPAPKTEAEMIQAKVEELNKAYPKEEVKEAVEAVSTPATGYADKAEVIAELNKRGIKFDARSSKAKLEELLK